MEEQHQECGEEIFVARDYPDVIVRSGRSHGNHTGVSRECLMERALLAGDEISGFVTAVALVRPTKSLLGRDARAVRKKMREKTFARNVSRYDLVQGSEELWMALEELIEFVPESLKA